MKRCVMIGLLFMMPLVSWCQRTSYIMFTDVGAPCGAVYENFPGIGSKTYYADAPGKQWSRIYAEYITFDSPLRAGLSLSVQGDMYSGGCCPDNSPACAQTVYGTLSGDGRDNWNVWAGQRGWSIGLNFITIVAPVVVGEGEEDRLCDRVDFKGIAVSLRLTAKWQVSNRATGGSWYDLPGNYATFDWIDNKTPFEPLEQLFARYIPVASGAIGSPSMPPSAVVSFRLYHPAPELTLTPRNGHCATTSGVTVTNATLLLPQVKVTFRKDNSPYGIDSVYNSNAFRGKFFALPPGSYEIAVRNWGGVEHDDCYKKYTFGITATNPAVDFTATPTPEICYGPDATGSITLSGIGGAGTTPPYTYAWAHGPTARDVSGLAGDRSYTVTVKDAYGCTGTKVIRVEEPDAIATTRAYLLKEVSCHTQTTGTHNDGGIRVEAAGGTGQLKYRVAGNSHSTNYQALPYIDDTYVDIGSLYADNYTVYVQDANGCIATFADKVLLAEPEDITYGELKKENVACAGFHTGSIQVVDADGGTAPYQYALDAGDYQPSVLFERLAAGGHTVWIRDKIGCRHEVSTTLSESPPITFGTPTVQLQSCAAVQDGSITVTTSGGTGDLEYALEDEEDAYDPSNTFTGLKTGTYSVYAKDTAGCVRSTIAIVGVKGAITGDITVSQVISCHGRQDGALNLTVTGGGTSPYSFLWTDNSATTEDRIGLGTGTYTVVITDAKTCEKTFNYNLTEPGELVLAAETSEYNTYGVRCAGGSDGTIDLMVTGGTAPYGYDWGAGRFTQDLSDLPAGTYDVTVVDNHGCSASLVDIGISAPAALAIDPPRSTHIRCNDLKDGVIEASGTGGAGIYQYALNGAWQTNGSSRFTGLDAGLYTVQLRDGNGCLSGTESVTLTEPSILVLTPLSKEETTCGQANGSLAVSISGGVGDYGYAWYRAGDPGTVIGTAPAIANLRSGDYTIVSEDSHDCPITQTFSINDSDGPQITQTLLQRLTCHDSHDGAIGVSIAGGLAPYTITWDIPGAAGTSVDHLTGGEHWIEVLDDRGCRGKETYTVDFPPALQLSKTLTSPLCMGHSNGRIAVQITGGNAGGYTYAWSTGETTATIENIKTGQYSVVVRDSKLCTLSESFTLTEPAKYTVDAGGDRTICVGQKLTLRAPDGAVSYLWTSDAGYSSTVREVVLTTPARYTLKAANANGCEAVDQFTLGTSDDLLSADFLMAGQAHAGDTVALIDISWPLPDNIGWTLPEGVQLLSQDDAYALAIFPEAGAYEVVLDTHLGECVDYLARRIIIEGDRDPDNGRVGAAMVSRFEVYPNPNDGAFTIAIDLREPADGSLTMVDLSGGKVFLAEALTASTSYSFQTAFERIPTGLYFLILRVEGKIYNKRIMIR